MKRYFMNLIIVAMMVVGGIKIFYSFSPIEERNEALLRNNTSQIDNSKSDNQARRDAKTKQAKLVTPASKRNSKKHPGDIKQAASDDLETRFLNEDSSGQELENIKTEIIVRLNEGDTATLQWVHRALASSQLKIQRHLIDVLRQTKSSEALEALFQFAQGADSGKGSAKMPALRAIAEVKHLQKASAQSRAAASAILEKYLENGSYDMELLYAAANGIIKLGSPEGISKLIGLLETKPQATGIIADALGKARSIAAISILKDRLAQDPELSDPTSNIIGSALGAIGTPKAVKALLTLAANAQGEEAKYKLSSWLSWISDERSIQLLLSAADEYRFADPQFGLQLQELGEQIDHRSLAPLPLLAGAPQLPDLAMAPPEMMDGGLNDPSSNQN